MYIKNINRYAKIFIVPRIVSLFKIRTIIIIMINISVINIKKKYHVNLFLQPIDIFLISCHKKLY